MVTKVHEAFNPGQFLTGNLNHFTVTNGEGDVVDLKHLVETTGTRATVVLLGTPDTGATEAVRIGVENNGAWDADTLAAALGGAYAVAAFVY